MGHQRQRHGNVSRQLFWTACFIGIYICFAHTERANSANEGWRLPIRISSLGSCGFGVLHAYLRRRQRGKFYVYPSITCEMIRRLSDGDRDCGNPVRDETYSTSTPLSVWDTGVEPYMVVVHMTEIPSIKGHAIPQQMGQCDRGWIQYSMG